MANDRLLQKSVLEELSWEPSIVAAHIGVAAHDGVVTLSGHVESYAQKQAAEAATRRVSGVRGVAEELEVKLPFMSTKTDDEIASAILSRLAWDVAVPRDVVTVKVEKGYATLSGEVKWHFEKEAAERAVRPLIGITGVSNQITIKPVVDTSHLSEDITHALHRSTIFDRELVHVAADGGKVILTGTVRSWHDRDVAADTAWAAEGATDVENNIYIV